MTQLSENRIAHQWKCHIERVPGEGYSVMEWTPGDQWVNAAGERPAGLTDNKVMEVLADAEKDFPNVNTSLIRKQVGNRAYLVVVAVWTPPKSNDCFLLTWYETEQVFLKRNSDMDTLSHLFSWVFWLLKVALILIGIIGIVGVYTGHVKTAWPDTQEEMSFEPPAVNPGKSDDKEVIEVVEAIQETNVPLPPPDDKYKNFVDDEVTELLDAFNKYSNTNAEEGVFVVTTKGLNMPLKDYVDNKDAKLKEIFHLLRKTKTKYESLNKEDAR